MKKNNNKKESFKINMNDEKAISFGGEGVINIESYVNQPSKLKSSSSLSVDSDHCTKLNIEPLQLSIPREPFNIYLAKTSKATTTSYHDYISKIFTSDEFSLWSKTKSIYKESSHLRAIFFSSCVYFILFFIFCASDYYIRSWYSFLILFIHFIATDDNTLDTIIPLDKQIYLFIFGIILFTILDFFVFIHIRAIRKVSIQNRRLYMKHQELIPLLNQYHEYYIKSN
ncbi:hypothetical protein WA158_006741 [Blastocystis sp. Blastoise]